MRRGCLDCDPAVSPEAAVRYHKLIERSWTDNALPRHGAHPIDLLFDSCGGVEPKGCAVLPDTKLPHTVSVLGKLPSGGAAAISVTYASHIYQTHMTIVGEKHTVETDGFSYAKSGLPGLEFKGHAQEVYEEAIHVQDANFSRRARAKGIL